MKFLALLLATVLNLVGVLPENFQFPPNPQPMTVYITQPLEDGDVRVLWMAAGAENMHLRYIVYDLPDFKEWPHGWLAAAGVEEVDGWKIYTGAPCFGMRTFQLVENDPVIPDPDPDPEPTPEVVGHNSFSKRGAPVRSHETSDWFVLILLGGASIFILRHRAS